MYEPNRHIYAHRMHTAWCSFTDPWRISSASVICLRVWQVRSTWVACLAHQSHAPFTIQHPTATDVRKQSREAWTQRHRPPYPHVYWLTVRVYNAMKDSKIPRRPTAPSMQQRKYRISYKLSLLTWKVLHTAEPSYLSELISHYAPTRNLRSANTGLLALPTGVTSHFSSRSFSVSSPSVWNSLPAHVRSIDNLCTFKRHLKSHLFQSAFTA